MQALLEENIPDKTPSKISVYKDSHLETRLLSYLTPIPCS